MFGLTQIVFASNSVLSVSPASLDKSANTSFNVSVHLDPVGNKACVVKGTLNFDKLSCQSITVANGLMPQTTPTCASPSFTVGIPGCASTAQNILSMSVKGTEAGQANLSFTGVNIIGAGTAVPFTSQGGTYNITTAVHEPTPTPTSTTTPKETTGEVMPQTEQEGREGLENLLPKDATPNTNDLGASAGTTDSRVYAYAFWALLALFIVFAIMHFVYRSKQKNVLK